MKISSYEIPQADVLEEVIKTVICISEGGQTYQDIAGFIGKVERQGRYYRKAAEILEFIETPVKNRSVLTTLGVQFIKSGATLTNPLLLQQILSARVFQRIISFLELHTTTGLTKDDIVNFLISVADISSDTMAPRRFSSVVSWLETLGIIIRLGSKFYLTSVSITKHIPILEFSNVDEPLLPRSSNLQEYQTVEMRTTKANEMIVTYKTLAASERADNAHRHLVNLVADKVREKGFIPKYNHIIDLATKVESSDYIFEMKSITETNSKSQVRTGLSQLYEYSYLQNLPNATLVLVIERELPQNGQWMIDYLENNRGVQIIWDGDDQLYGTEKSIEKLPFLQLVRR